MSHLSASSTHCALPRKATIAQSNVSQENRNPPEQAMAAPSICLSEAPDANGFLGNSPQLWNFTLVLPGMRSSTAGPAQGQPHSIPRELWPGNP